MASSNKFSQAFLFALLLLLACVPALAEKKTAPPRDAIFQDVNKVALIIFVPDDYAEAFDCHGQEEVCANEAESVIKDPATRQAYIDELKAAWQAYPDVLHPDRLGAIFVRKLRERILPLLTPGADGKTPDVIVLTPDDWAKAPSADRNALIVTVKIRMIVSGGKREAYTNIYLSRQDIYWNRQQRYGDASLMSEFQGMVTRRYSTTIPLDAPPEKLPAIVESYVEPALPATGEFSGLEKEAP